MNKYLKKSSHVVQEKVHGLFGIVTQISQLTISDEIISTLETI